MTEKEALSKYCVRLGDNALVLSYRLSEWCSKGPTLEEDLALTNTALDLIGRSQAFLNYAAELNGDSQTADDLAYRRAEKDFYNNLITELPNGGFASTVVRQFYIAAFENYFFEKLQYSANPTLAALAAKTLKEVRYHLAHFRDWVLRLGDGTEDSHRKIQKAANAIWKYTGELFEMDDTDTLLLDTNVAVDLSAIQPAWEQYVAEVFEEATLTLPNSTYMQTGSRKGIHTEHLGHILAEMQFLQRAYPDAKW